MPHHRPGVDAGDPDDVLADQLVLQRAGGAPVGGARRRVAHRVAGDPDLVAAALGVLAVPAGVADLRRGGHHDLAVIAGIGQRLLIAGHAGGEHGFAERLADLAERRPGEDAAVFEHQYGFAHAAPSCLGLQPVVVFAAVVCPKPGVDLDARRQPPPDRQYPIAGRDLTGHAALGADGRDRLLRNPNRVGADAFQQDSLGIAGQHRLAAVAQIAGRDPVVPGRRQRAADNRRRGW